MKQIKLSGRSTARKSPIGSTNNQWEETPPLNEVSLYRIYDRYEEKIIAMAVHTSLENIEKMKRFEYDFFGTALNYSYNNYRTEDYSDVELEQSENIFSKVVLAAKAVHKTKDEVKKRYRFKRKLMRELMANKKYTQTAVAATIYFIDYLLQLPKEETEKLGHELGPEIRRERGLMELYNEENSSPTVLHSFAEQLDRGFAKGIEQGLEQGKKDVIYSGMKQGLDISTLAMLTGYSEERVRGIMEEVQD